MLPEWEKSVSFEKECVETAKHLDHVATLVGCTLTPNNVVWLNKAAKLLREVVRGI